MSFASEVKGELAALPVRSACCRAAQVYGMLELGHHFTGADITLQTENPTVAAGHAKPAFPGTGVRRCTG